MRYADYDNKIFTDSDLEKYKRIFEKDIEEKRKNLKVLWRMQRKE